MASAADWIVTVPGWPAPKVMLWGAPSFYDFARELLVCLGTRGVSLVILYASRYGPSPLMATLKPALLLLKPRFRPISALYNTVVWSALAPTLLSKDAMGRLGAECGISVGYGIGSLSEGVWVKYTSGVWMKITGSIPTALTAGYLRSG